MKKLLLVLFTFLSVTLVTNAQTDLSLWGGYSWLNGVGGVELQYSNFAVSAGYFPTKMPGSGSSLSSFSGAFTFYGKNNKFLNEHSGRLGACYYGSIGVASAGYRSETSYNGGPYGGGIVRPMTIGMIGVKSYANKWQFKLGVGYGWCDVASAWTWEAGFGYALYSSHSF